MPRIKTTPMVRVALWALRIYLLILLSLIGLKFTRMYSQSKKESGVTGASGSKAERAPKPANSGQP